MKRHKKGRRLLSSDGSWLSLVLAGLVTAATALSYSYFCPIRYRIPEPYPEPALISLFLVSAGIAGFRSAWVEWKFWVSLIVAASFQVWASGQLILHGWAGGRRRGKGFLFIGMLAWGISYAALFVAQKGIEKFWKKGNDRSL